jgi:hypothetical protein
LQDISRERVTTIAQIFKVNTNFINDKRRILNEEEIEIVKYLKKIVDLKEKRAEVIGTIAQLNWIYVLYDYSDSEISKTETNIQTYEKLYNVDNVNTEYIICFKKSNLWKETRTELEKKYYYIYATEWGYIMKKHN